MSDKGWLGGDEAELEAAEEEKARLEQKESSQKVYEVLKKDSAELISKKIGLDGELIESPPSFSDEEEIILLDSPVTCSDKEEVGFSKKKSASLERTMKATGILSSLLRELIAVGTTESWVNNNGGPDKKFVDIEGKRLKEAVGRLVPFNDRELVYRILRNEVCSKKDRDRIVGDILLHFAFPRCS